MCKHTKLLFCMCLFLWYMVFFFSSFFSLLSFPSLPVGNLSFIIRCASLLKATHCIHQNKRVMKRMHILPYTRYSYYNKNDLQKHSKQENETEMRCMCINKNNNETNKKIDPNLQLYYRA